MVDADTESPLLETRREYRTTDEHPKLNEKNFLNLFFYIFNVVFTYGVGTAGWFGTPTNIALSDKYQSLITPNSKAFTIWAIIFVSQAVFSVVQLFPRFRGKPMIQKGVGYWYVAVCLMQVGWTFSFGYESIPLSMVFMAALWMSLVGLLYSQYNTKSDGSLLEFWLLRFPFAIHAGWITAATALNANVVSVWKKDPATTQLALAIVSLAVLHAVSVWVLFNIKRPNYTIACVLSWASGWIHAELQHPTESVVSMFGETIIVAVAYAARAVSYIILAQVITRLIMFGYQFHRSTNLDSNNQDTA